MGISLGQEILPFHIHITSKEIKQLNKLTSKSMEAVFLQRLLICEFKIGICLLILTSASISCS